MWSIWGTNVWKCFPIRTEGGGICKLLLPHGPSSLPILIVMRPARASSAAGRCHGRPGHAAPPPGRAAPPAAPARPRGAGPGRGSPRQPPPAGPGPAGLRSPLPAHPGPPRALPEKKSAFLLKAVTITIESLATNRWLLFHTNACLCLYVLHLFVANTCHSINRFGHLM